MSKFVSFTDTEIINLVDDLLNQRKQISVAELKELQSELVNRQCPPSCQAGIITLIMNQNAQAKMNKPQESAPVVPQDTKQQGKIVQKGKSEDVKPKNLDYPVNIPVKEDENYPILNFLISFYKVVAWAGVVIFFGGVVAFSVFWAQNNSNSILCAVGIALIISALWMIIFLSLSEGVRLKLDIEKHLRRINR